LICISDKSFCRDDTYPFAFINAFLAIPRISVADFNALSASVFAATAVFFAFSAAFTAASAASAAFTAFSAACCAAKHAHS